MMAHHASLVDCIQGAIVVGHLNISAASVAEIIDMLRVEGSLQGRQVRIRLCLVRMIHALPF